MILIQIFAFVVCAAFLSAQAAYWWWWFIGSPQAIGAGDIEQAIHTEGRIFSFIGRFIAKRYSQLELEKYSEFIENAPYNTTTNQYESKQPYQPTHLNFWKIAGCCIYCMAVWAAAVLAVFWYFVAAQYLDYNGGFLANFAIWVFYTVLTLFFIKKELD